MDTEILLYQLLKNKKTRILTQIFDSIIINIDKDEKDLIDDIVHELAHHLEVLFPEQIYSDVSLINEFLKKRNELKFELQTEGYWVNEYDFDKNIALLLTRMYTEPKYRMNYYVANNILPFILLLNI